MYLYMDMILGWLWRGVIKQESIEGGKVQDVCLSFAVLFYAKQMLNHRSW